MKTDHLDLSSRQEKDGDSLDSCGHHPPIRWQKAALEKSYLLSICHMDKG